MASTLVPSFFQALIRLGLRQRDIATQLGCSESQVSRLGSGERTLPLEDFRALLKKLVHRYPEARPQLVKAALGPLLQELGCELVVRPLPPPVAPASNLVVLADYRQERALRRAA